jgi:hypothetical protein
MLYFYSSTTDVNIMLSQTLGDKCKAKELLMTICGRRVNKPDQVINLLSYETVNGITFTHAPPGTVLNTEDINKFRRHLERYLRGEGHPMHMGWGLDHVNQECRDLVAHDKVMRCKRLLMLATGSDLLPSNIRQHILVCMPILIMVLTLSSLFSLLQIQFIHQLPDEYLYIPENPDEGWKVRLVFLVSSTSG